MGFNIHIYYRNSSSKMTFPGMAWSVDRMAWSAQGGCNRAVVSGLPTRLDTTQRALRNLRRNNVEILDVWEALELLRCPVIITDETNFPVWWGYVESAQVQDNKIQVGTSLEKMCNKVRVVYTEVNTAGTIGERAQTDWVQNDTSISEYGTKEGQFTLNQATADQAEARADVILERLKYPLPKRNFGDFGEPKATLNLRGWFFTLDWELYEDSSGKESYETIGDGLQALGNTAATTAVAQSFQLASAVGWDANVIRLRMKKEGSPTDNVTVQLRSDSSGAPGAVLASASMAGANVSENLNWHEFELSTRVSLSASTTYWISIERSGSLDASNYYKVDGNEDLGYTRGVFKIWTGSAWVDRSPDADMLFAVSGVTETSLQIETIADTAGQFFEDVSVQIASGVYSSPYRDGDRTALAEIMDLLESGTTNERRMLATVEYDRTLVIKEEPEAWGNDDYLVDNEGKMYDLGGGPLSLWRYPVGVWVRLKTVVPDGLNTSYLADPTITFIEDLDYNLKTEKITMRERDMARLLEVE